MRYEKKEQSSSLELVVLGLIAALVMSLAFPLISHVVRQDPPLVSVDHSTPRS